MSTQTDESGTIQLPDSFSGVWNEFVLVDHCGAISNFPSNDGKEESNLGKNGAIEVVHTKSPSENTVQFNIDISKELEKETSKIISDEILNNLPIFCICIEPIKRRLCSRQESPKETKLLSRTDGFINVCKACCGASVFAIPWALGQSGLLTGCLSTIFFAFLTYFTLCWLGECSHLHPEISKPTYPQIAEAAFGKVGYFATWIALICVIVGVCSSYLTFIASQISYLIDIQWIDQTFVILVMTVPLMLFSLMRSYSFLVPFNVLGLVSLFAACVVIIFESAQNINFEFDDNENNVKYLTNDHEMSHNHYPLLLGNIAAIFLIHPVILPIEQNMKDRVQSQISSDYKVALKWSLLTLCSLLLIFGGFSYVAFGEDVCGNIMNNLDQNNTFTKIVIITICINLFFTYPLVLFPMTEALEHCVFDLKDTNSRKIEIQRNLLRICLVLMTAGIAIIIPNFSLLAGLTGALGCNFLGLILPPIMYFRLKKMNKTYGDISIIEKVVGCISTTFGVGMLFVCTYSFIYATVISNENFC